MPWSKLGIEEHSKLAFRGKSWPNKASSGPQSNIFIQFTSQSTAEPCSRETCGTLSLCQCHRSTTFSRSTIANEAGTMYSLLPLGGPNQHAQLAGPCLLHRPFHAALLLRVLDHFPSATLPSPHRLHFFSISEFASLKKSIRRAVVFSRLDVCQNRARLFHSPDWRLQ